MGLLFWQLCVRIKTTDKNLVDATCQNVMRFHKLGMSALTHLYSCMATVRRVNAYRVAGAIEAGYLLDDLYEEVIADGCHLPGEIMRRGYYGESLFDLRKTLLWENYVCTESAGSAARGAFVR